jgi:MFS family permease
MSQQVFYVQAVLGRSASEAGETAAGLTVLLVIGLVVGIALSGPISDRVGRRKPFVIGSSAVISLASVIPLIAPSSASLAAFILLTGVAIGIYQAVDNALMTQVLPSPAAAGKDMGFLNIAGVVPQVIAPALAALVAAAAGFQALFVGVIGFAILGALAILPIRGVR